MRDDMTHKFRKADLSAKKGLRVPPATGRMRQKINGQEFQ